MRDDRHGRAGIGETAHDRALRPVVHHRHMGSALGREDVGLGRRNVRDESLSFHRGLRAHLLDRAFDCEDGLVRNRRRTHRARVAQPEDQGAGVEPVETDEPALA